VNTYIWLVRREFWENRAIWTIPAVIGGFLILAALFGKVEVLGLASQIPGRPATQLFLVAVGLTFFAVMSIYSTWYLLDCLHADRKDRSVLFWKSLPISDTATVLSKLLTALIAIPLVYFALADLTTLLMAFIISIRASSSIGGSLWHADVWFQIQVLWLYLIVTAAIWYLPIVAYLLVVSSWAKRAVMLWALLPPFALILAERWFFGTQVIAAQLWERAVGLVGAFNINLDDGSWVVTPVGHEGMIQTPVSVWHLLAASGFLSSPETWIGVGVGVALTFCAVQLRTRRTEI
jgi:ABC-2 type transport system permease protein